MDLTTFLNRLAYLEQQGQLSRYMRKARASATRPDVVDDQLVAQLADRARAEGLQLTGEGGLLALLTKKVVESALEGEMDDHLGYAKHDPAGRNTGNSRNGRRGKTVLTEAGPVEIATPAGSRGHVHPAAGAQGPAPADRAG